MVLRVCCRRVSRIAFFKAVISFLFYVFVPAGAGQGEKNWSSDHRLTMCLPLKMKLNLSEYSF